MQIPAYLLNEHYDDRYFDVVNAIDEAEHIFFKGNLIAERLGALPEEKKEFIIGETGFGAGRNVIALMGFLDKSTFSGLSLTYYSVELHPITSARMSSILSGFRNSTGPLIDLLVDSYGKVQIDKAGWHSLNFVRRWGVLTLNLWIGEALEMVCSLPGPCDAWFLDGHGPKKNPAIWRPELLEAIGKKTVMEGTCATFTVARAVSRGLESAGFSVEQVPGFGGKKAVLAGTKL